MFPFIYAVPIVYKQPSYTVLTDNVVDNNIIVD